MIFDSLLLGVGAQKAGTSWLARLLSKSEHIEFPERKELHYFDMLAGLNEQLPQLMLSRTAAAFGLPVADYIEKVRGGEKAALESIRSVLDDQWYRQQFAGDKTYCADFTPEYGLLGEQDYRRIKSLAKSVKLVFIMRDPVTRTLSAFRYFHQNRGLDTTALSNDQIIKILRGKMYQRRSDYLSTINTLRNTFPERDLLFLFYENMMADKNEALSCVSEFLEIPRIDAPERVVEKRINESRSTPIDPDIYTFLEDHYQAQKTGIRELFADTPDNWFASQ